MQNCIATDKNCTLNSKKNKGFVAGAKEKSGAPETPPLSMNHVTGQDRKNEVTPQNNVNDVEEMEIQEGNIFFLCMYLIKEVMISIDSCFVSIYLLNCQKYLYI